MPVLNLMLGGINKPLSHLQNIPARADWEEPKDTSTQLQVITCVRLSLFSHKWCFSHQQHLRCHCFFRSELWLPGDFRRREVLTAVIKKKKKSPECGAITSNLPVLDQLQQLQFYDPQIDVVFVSHLHSLPFYVLTFTSDSSLMMFIKCLRVRN